MRALKSYSMLAALSVDKTPFSRPFGMEAQADAARDSFKHLDSDLLTLVSAFNVWRKAYLDDQADVREVCREKFLSHQNLSLIEETRDQLLKQLIGVKSVGRDVVDKRRYG